MLTEESQQGHSTKKTCGKGVKKVDKGPVRLPPAVSGLNKRLVDVKSACMLSYICFWGFLKSLYFQVLQYDSCDTL